MSKFHRVAAWVWARRLLVTGVVTACVSVVIVASVLLGPKPPASPEGGWRLPEEAQAALLREDWAAVGAALGGPAEALPGPARTLKGLAALARNRNNEAACVLQSLTEEDLRDWQAWTRQFSTRHGEMAVAHFLAGAALARQHEWNAAASAFDRALALDAGHALTLNASGVVHAALGRGDVALARFRRAAAAQPGLADVHASRGAYWLREKNGAEGALAAFDRALQISPDFVLALIGRTSVLMALSRWDDARKGIEAASETPGCLAHVVAEATAGILAFMNDGRGGRAALTGDDSPGMTLQRRLDDLVQHPSQGTMNSFVNHLRRNPQERAQGLEMFRNHVVSDPGAAQKFAPLAERGLSWNAAGGPAQAFTSVMEGLKMTVGKEVHGTRLSSDFDLGPLGRHQAGVTRENFQMFNDIRGALGRGPAGAEAPGGVTTSPVGSPVDTGEWPSVARYGLLYPVPDATAMAPKREGEVARR